MGGGFDSGPGWVLAAFTRAHLRREPGQATFRGCSSLKKSTSASRTSELPQTGAEPGLEEESLAFAATV